MTRRDESHDLWAHLEDARASGAHVGPPPLLLGHRGAPREAPENTLASLRRALAHGLDGVEYDVRRCASGELVLLHDETLERTTDGAGPVAARDLRELFALDAGGWFSRRFAGEPVPLVDEALELDGESGGAPPLHMIELKEPGLVERLAERLTARDPLPPVRVASFRRDVTDAAHAAGLPAMLLAVRADEDDRRWARDLRIAAYGVGPGGWDGGALDADWGDVERWSWAVDEPDELLRLARVPLDGLNTNEPHRALAARALARLAPRDAGPWPVQVPDLLVEPESLDAETRARGEWYGSWDVVVRVRNPFPFPVEARCGVFVPHGAFEVDGLPRVLELEPHEEREVGASLAGGARGPGPDPLFAVLLAWRGAGPVGVVDGAPDELRAGGRLLFDAPLLRRRVARADGLAQRLELLREHPGDPAVTLSLRRRGPELVLALENAGRIEEPHLVARLGGTIVRGGRGLRLFLPDDFDLREGGVPFSCGVEGHLGGAPHVRRWSGGIPEGLGNGYPGILLPVGRG